MQGELNGRRLGNYRLQSVLGRGGMGVVYRAEQTSLGRTVAVKVIAPELSQDPLLRDRFKQEARLAASLDHPNVLPIYEADEADDLLYIAMRYVEGVDLRGAIQTRGCLSPHEAATVVMQIAGALDAAHSRGLVHRDVKPANVLLAGDTEQIAYLTDFGLTKYVGAVSGPTQSGQFVGTPDYAAPEQIQGQAVNAATDVYALGCVLHEALSGRVPFVRENNVAKMFAHISDPPPHPSDFAEGVGPALDEVVVRALAKDPLDRYPSAGDLGRAAVAAAAHRSAPSTEHSVAVGAAAVQSTAATQRRRRGAAKAGAVGPASVPTAHLPDDVPGLAPGATPRPIHVHRGQDGRRRPLRLLAIGVSILALLVAGAAGAYVLIKDQSDAKPGAAAGRATSGAPTAGTPTSGSSPATSEPESTTSANGRLPAVPQSVMAADVGELLRRFYGAQIKYQYGVQRGLTTERYQRNVIDDLGFSTWATDYQATAAPYLADAQNIDVTILDQDPADGVVTVDARGMRYTKPGSSCSMWEGITWARYEQGRWRYDPSVKATAARQARWGHSDKVIGSGCL